MTRSRCKGFLTGLILTFIHGFAETRKTAGTLPLANIFTGSFAEKINFQTVYYNISFAKHYSSTWERLTEDWSINRELVDGRNNYCWQDDVLLQVTCILLKRCAGYLNTFTHR